MSLWGIPWRTNSTFFGSKRSFRLIGQTPSLGQTRWILAILRDPGEVPCDLDHSCSYFTLWSLSYTLHIIQSCLLLSTVSSLYIIWFTASMRDMLVVPFARFFIIFQMISIISYFHFPLDGFALINSVNSSYDIYCIVLVCISLKPKVG